MSKLSRFAVAVFAVLLSGCTVSTVYPTIVLPQSFETSAERIEVKPPLRRYRSSFYNVSLGEYKVESTFIGDVTKRRLSNKPDRRVTEDNTLWNLLLKQRLDIEKVTYEQYRVEETSGFGFSVQSPTIDTIQAQCSRSVLGLDNTEVSRSSLRFGEEDDDEGFVESYGEWLATQLSCNLQQAGNLWIVTSTETLDSLASLEIQGGDTAYSVKVLRESYADEPGRGGRVENTPDFMVAAGDSIPGVGVFQQGRQIAAASLSEGNNWIWLSPEVNGNEKALLVSSLHTLILHYWIY